MPFALNNPQKNALIATTQALADCLVFFPRGFMLPFAKLNDKFKYWIYQKHLPRVYIHACQMPQEAYAKTQALNHYLKKLTDKLAIFFYYLFYIQFWLAGLITPDSVFQIPVLEKLKKIPGVNWVQNNPVKSFYFGILPLFMAGLMVNAFGWMVLFECYLFVVCSIWSGLLINTLSNMFVLGRDSEEWRAISDFVRNLFSANKNENWPNQKKFIAYQILRFTQDLLIAGLFKRTSDFFCGCLAFFYTWLGLYIATKFAANTSPEYVIMLENHLNQQPDEPGAAISYSLMAKNTVWLGLYHIVHELASTVSIETYHNLRENNPQASPSLSV